MFMLYSFAAEFFLSSGYFKGTHNDFLAFYATGKLVVEGHIAQVYDPSALTAIQRTIIPHEVGALGYMPFLNPPFVAILLAPMGLTDVNTARLAWIVLSVIVMIGIAWCMTRSIENKWKRGLCMFLIASSYPVFQNLIQGQLSILLTAAVLAGIYMAEKGKLFYSGLFLTALVVKPQLAVFVGIALLAFRQWEVIKGMIIGTLALLLVTLPFTGIDIYHDYAQFASGVTSGHFTGAGTIDRTIWQGNMKYMYSLQGLAVMLFGQTNPTLTNSFVFGVGVVLVGLFAWVSWRRHTPSLRSAQGRLVLAAGIAIALLINPHAYSQDAILMLAILAVILPIWRDKLRTIVYFLAAVALMYLDQQTGSHWTTLLLISFASIILIRNLTKKHIVP